MPTTITWSTGPRSSIRSVAVRADAGPTPMIPATMDQRPVVPAWENTGLAEVRARPPARTTALSSGRMGVSSATRLRARSSTATIPSWRTNR